MYPLLYLQEKIPLFPCKLNIVGKFVDRANLSSDSWSTRKKPQYIIPIFPRGHALIERYLPCSHFLFPPLSSAAHWWTLNMSSGGAQGYS
jgi:hypothetical protein